MGTAPAPAQRPQAPVGYQQPPAAPPVRIRTADGQSIEVDASSLQEALAASQPPADGDPNNYKRRMWSWRGNPRGGLGETMNVGACPGCGSINYFSRAGGVTRGPAPAPHCYDCGYPTIQTGSPMGAGQGAKAVGPAHQAVQARYVEAPTGGVQYGGH